MAMTVFHLACHEIGQSEYRFIQIQQHARLPAGHYGFWEFYCDEQGCDCRRVIFGVVAPHLGNGLITNIGFGWEPLKYYRKWARHSEDGDLVGPYIDMLGPRSEYDDALLGLCRDHLVSDEAYVKRLARHYELFKRAQGVPGARGTRPRRVVRRKRRRRR
jgi:hypothetical protein